MSSPLQALDEIKLMNGQTAVVHSVSESGDEVTAVYRARDGMIMADQFVRRDGTWHLKNKDSLGGSYAHRGFPEATSKLKHLLPPHTKYRN